MSKQTTMAYIKDIATRLNNPSIYGGASLMVGAGFSKNAEGIGNRKSPPNWSELAIAMYDELYPKPLKDDDYGEWETQRKIKTSGKNTLHLAEEYIAFFDRSKMNALIEKNIDDEMFVPSELHKRLLLLNWKDIFTTNYDTLLEKTRECISNNKDYRVVLAQDNLPGSGGRVPRIIKLHGSIPGVRPYIISEEDFRSYPNKYAAFVNTVQQALIETTLCLVGFSGDDPNFLSWHGWLHDNFGENCPQIYLIGLFGDMNESEKNILRRRKIAVVDLEDLLVDSENDKYKDAYNKFFDLIEEEAKEKEVKLNEFKTYAPYYGVDDLVNWNQDKEAEYVKEILRFSDDILNKNGNVVLLPERERNIYREYFSDQFYNLIFRCSNINKDYIHTISNLIQIQRLCLIPLYDNQANKLKEICHKTIEKKWEISSKWIFQIYLYLLEMYRIDSDEEMYSEMVSKCKDIIDDLSDIEQGLYRIELAKHAAGMFNIEEAINNLKLIDTKNIKISIAKAGIYVQLGENDTAEELLKNTLDEFNKLKMDDSFNASYKSYLSLCYNTLNKWWINNDNYSDLEYKGNSFQTRNIILEMQNNLREEIIKSRIKDDERDNVFEVNYSRSQIILCGDNKLQRLSFEFILMLDTLCLPLFSDQSLLLSTVMQNIKDTSQNTYWELSFMVRANNKDVIEQIFSRRSIATTDLKLIDILYDNIWNCVQKTDYKNFNQRYAFLSHNNALNILSRMVVFLDDEKVVDLIKYIAKIKFDKEDCFINEIRVIISRMSTRFNGKIGKLLLKEIFFKADSRLYLASYFSKIKIEIDDSDELFQNAIRLVKEGNESERDNGIAQLRCLWKNCPKTRFKNQIEDAIWQNNIEDFPKSNIYNEILWEELPYPDKVDFSKLYKNFICNGLVNNISNINNNLFKYVNLFFLTSPISKAKFIKIDIDNSFIEKILEAIENKKDIEKPKVFDLFEENTEKQKTRYIMELLTMIYVIKYKDDEKRIHDKIEQIIALLESKEVNAKLFSSVKVALNKGIFDALNIIKSVFWSNDKYAIAEASLGIQMFLFIVRDKKEDILLVKDAILECMEKLQYSDIKYVKDAWNMLRQLISIIVSDDVNQQQRVGEIFNNCIQSYSNRGLKGDKYYFEAMYNCNKTLRSYYDEIILKDYNVDQSLLGVIQSVKDLNVPELSAIWE